MYRSSHRMRSLRKGELRNFAKFTGKHLCQGLIFNKVAGFRPATLFKKRPWHRCFSVNFAKFLRTPFLDEHLRWLLLNVLCITIPQQWKDKLFFLDNQSYFLFIFRIVSYRLRLALINTIIYPV